MWSAFFREHFPRGDEHAELLWHQWRTPLLKDEHPGPGVALSHGSPDAHWQITFPAQGGGLIVNLESM